MFLEVAYGKNVSVEFGLEKQKSHRFLRILILPNIIKRRLDLNRLLRICAYTGKDFS